MKTKVDNTLKAIYAINDFYEKTEKVNDLTAELHVTNALLMDGIMSLAIIADSLATLINDKEVE